MGKIKDRIYTIKMIMFVIVLFVIIGFIVFITTYRFPIGDDCLGQTTYGILAYVDEFGSDTDLGPVIHDIKSWITSIRLHMTYWSGRFTPVLLCGLLAMLGQKITGVVSGIVFILLIYEIVFLAYKKKGERFYDIQNKTYIFVILFYVFIYKNVFVDWAFMWTMMCHYVIPTFLLLSYYCIALELFYEKNVERMCLKDYILLNVLGLFSAASNEAICATFWVVFGVYFVLHIKELKLSISKMIVANTGLFLGSLITFFSPGNYVRMRQSHDMERMYRPYIEKLIGAIYSHGYVITFGKKLWVIGVFSILVLIGLLAFVISKENVKRKFIDVCPYFVGMCGSIFIWGMASYTPIYGMIGFMVLFYIFILKLLSGISEMIEEKTKMSLCVNALALMVIIFTIIGNLGWMRDLYSTRIIWDKSIETAEKGQIVYVPAFPDSCNNIFTMHNWINSDKQLAGKDYQTVYECTLRIKQ